MLGFVRLKKITLPLCADWTGCRRDRGGESFRRLFPERGKAAHAKAVAMGVKNILETR